MITKTVKVKTTINGEQVVDETTVDVFETIDELMDALAGGGDRAKFLFATTNSGLETKAKNTKRASMRPVDPKAQFKRTQVAIINALEVGEMTEKEALAAMKAAKADLLAATAV